MSLRLIVASLLLSAGLRGQVQSPPAEPTPAPASLLDQLVANAQAYNATLPSLTADESIVSEASVLFFHDKTQAQGTFRVLRGAPGEPLQESRHITVLNGKPVPPDRNPGVPFTLLGGFGGFQQMFFTPHHRLCFLFTMLPNPGPGGTLQLAISSPDQVDPQLGCSPERQGLVGLALIDPATGQLTHLERTVPDDIAARGKLAPFASVDLAPAQVGDHTYWLPTVVIGRFHNGKVKGQFTARYGNYHRYAASITLLPGATEVEHPPP